MGKPDYRLHYFSDQGNSQYNPNRELLVELAELLDLEKMQQDPEYRTKQRADFLEKACGIIHSYQIHDTMPGMGGCLTLEQWEKTTDPDPIENVLKKMMFDLTNKGFVYREFLLAAWDAIVEIQMYAVIGDTP